MLVIKIEMITITLVFSFLVDFQDTNVLCEKEHDFKWNVLCQIDLVKEQCPKRCSSCPQHVGNENILTIIQEFIILDKIFYEAIID